MSEKFEQAIKRYYDKRKELEYLDLAVEPKYETEVIEGIEFSCYKKGYKHCYHSDNKQLNLICDLQLNTLHNLNTVYDRILLLSNVSFKHFHLIEEKLEKLQKEVFALEDLDKRIKRIPSKKDITGLIDSIVDKPKEIEREAIQLSQKLEKKIERLEVLIEQLHKQWT